MACFRIPKYQNGGAQKLCCKNLGIKISILSTRSYYFDIQYRHTTDWYIVPYRHNFELFLIPRFFSYSCLGRPSAARPAQAALRGKTWMEKIFKIMAVWNNVSISSVGVCHFLHISFFNYKNAAWLLLKKEQFWGWCTIMFNLPKCSFNSCLNRKTCGLSSWAQFICDTKISEH